ncbi:MAG: SDR family NAD(P)-dependent oxidoreductase [Acidobacteriota bacterium]
MINLSGKVAVVTGGARGIGRSCCLLMAQAGARVIVNYRKNVAAARHTVEEIQSQGGEAAAAQADVSRPEACRELLRESARQFGGIDILVNNAGIWKEAPVEKMTDEQWDETMAINLRGPFLCCREAIPYLKARETGRIINISSTAGQRGEPLHSHYAASKGALQSFTKSLAVELAPHRITVNCVAPGWIATDMCEEPFRGEGRKAIESGIPLGRVGRPEEIAATVLFLASSLSSYLTGEIINVNGGSVLCG